MCYRSIYEYSIIKRNKQEIRAFVAHMYEPKEHNRTSEIINTNEDVACYYVFPL